MYTPHMPHNTGYGIRIGAPEDTHCDLVFAVKLGLSLSSEISPFAALQFPLL